MATQFSGLPTKTTAAATDIVPIRDVSSGSDKETTVAGFAAGVAANVPSGGQSSASLSNPYKFLVYRNGAQFIGATTESKVSFDTKVYDTGSNFDATTNFRFVATVAGFYAFYGTSALQVGSNNPYICDLYKNGSQYLRLSQINQPGFSGSICMAYATPPLQLAAADYIEIFVYNGSAGTTNLNVGSAPMQTFFGGELISIT